MRLLDRALSLRQPLCAAAMFVATTSAAWAQKADDAMSCGEAAKIVAKGHPEKKLRGAFLALSACGAVGANALATGMAAYTRETDPAALQDFMQFVDAWRDSTIFDAATQLATNSSASPVARVFSVRHLLVLTHPYMLYTFAGLTAGTSTVQLLDGSELTTMGCGGAIGSEMADRVGTPLPADFATRIQATLATLIASPSTPDIVRNAARCGS